MKAGIVGYGVMGRILAYHLINAGWQVTVFDKDNHEGNNNCGMVAAGLLTPATELENSSAVIFSLGIKTLKQHLPEMINHLDEFIYFQKKGSLLLAHPRDETEMHRFINVINGKIDTQENYCKINQIQISALEPELAKFNEGYYFPNECQIDNQSLMNSLHRYLLNKKICWLPNTLVQAVQPRKIILSSSIEDFDMVFDCRGRGAKSLFSDLRGVRGELIWLQTQEVNISRPIRLLHPRYRLYISPRPHNIYILGASEIESEDDSAISVKTTLELLSAAYYLHPGFAEARIINTMTNCRPTLADHLPKIKFTDGLISINGLYRHGFLIAPSLADDVINYLSNGTSAIHYPQIWEELNDNHSIQ